MDKTLLIFDYDGTLHETMALYKSAVSAAVLWLKEGIEKGTLPVSLEAGTERILAERFNKPPADAQLKKWIGMNADDMWLDFAPELPTALRFRAIKYVGEHMNRMTASDSRWYPGAEEMLSSLKAKGYQMILLSNCTEIYAVSHWTDFRMDRWFSGFLACETFGNRPKEWIAGNLLSGREQIAEKAVCGKIEPGFTNAVFIGDRASDMKAAKDTKMPFIGCLYGYGSKEELSAAEAIAEAPADIPELIEKVKLNNFPDR